MIEQVALEIAESPQTYADWLAWFRILQTKNIGKKELALLKQGKCTASEQSISFLEEQLIETINIMIKRYILLFQKELEMRFAYGEYDGLYLLFQKLAEWFRGCLFFKPLTFMSHSFREELERSVIGETTRFWNKIVGVLYNQCTEENNRFLEDELYMIQRIKLF